VSRFDEAIDLCEAGLGLAPDNRKLLNTLASSLSGAGRYDEALALLERMIRAHPRYAKASHFAGVIHTKRGDCDAAVAAFARATEIDPSDSASFVAAAECLMLHRRAEAALGPIERALAINGWDVRALALKTLALAELGRVDEERWLADPGRLVRTVRLGDLGYTADQVGMLNRALSAFASDEPSMREDPPEYATEKGWHTTVNLAETRNEAVDVLKRFIGYAFEQRLKALPEEDPDHPFVRGAPKRFHLDLWAVKMASGGKMLPHIHLDGWLSGVYYVDVPSIVNDPDGGEAGWLKLGAPRSDIKLTREPITRTVKPAPGLLVTFPSYIWHDTVPLPQENNEQRLCLAFDLHPRPAA
jgi:pentatricopeptide repeat protein